VKSEELAKIGMHIPVYLPNGFFKQLA